MPIYKAKIKCFVGNSLREIDEEFEYNGEFCKHLELMTKAELEVYGRTIGVELDRRQTKDTLIKQLEAANK